MVNNKINRSVIMTKDDKALAAKYDIKSPTAFLNRSDYSGSVSTQKDDKKLQLEYTHFIEKLSSSRRAFMVDKAGDKENFLSNRETLRSGSSSLENQSKENTEGEEETV
jgi:hypothetical protein